MKNSLALRSLVNLASTNLALITTSFTVGLFVFGCKETQQPLKKLNTDLAKIQRENEEYIERINQQLTMGGQPGYITMNGVAVKDADKLDSRITVSQSSGRNRSGVSAPVTMKDPVQLNTLEAEQIEKRKNSFKALQANGTYINLGCQLEEPETAGLTDISNKVDLQTFGVLTATRIFICGEYKANQQIFLSLTASDILLKEASITFAKSFGSLSLSSDTLVLLGKNKITSLGQNSYQLVPPASDISLYVASEIYGDGELAISSEGGSCIADK